MPTAPLASPQQTIEEVFLTPRVLDKRAYDDYTTGLKRLIEDASGQGQSLTRTAADVRVLRDQLLQAAGDAQKRLDSAIRLTTAIDQRIADARSADPRVVEMKAPQAKPPAAGPATNGAAGTTGGPAAGVTAREQANGHHDPSATDTTPSKAAQALEARLVAIIESRVRAEVDRRLSERAAAEAQALDARATAIEARIDAKIQSLLAAAREGLIEESRAASEAVRREVWSLVEEARDLATQTSKRSDARGTELASQVEALGERIDSIAQSFSEAATTTAGADTAAAQAQIDAVEAAIASAAERARSFEKSVEAAARRFASETNEQGAKVTAAARDAIENARAECEAAVRQISTGATLRVRKAQSDAEEVLDAMEREATGRLDAARQSLAATFESLSRDAHERATWIKAALEQVESSGLARLEGSLNEAKRLTDPAKDGSLAATIERGTRLREGVETNLVQISDLSKQVGLMRDLLARSIMDGVSRIDAMDAHVEELLSSTARAIERYSGEVESLRASIQTAGTSGAGRDATTSTGSVVTNDADLAEGTTSPDADGVTHVEQRIAELKTQIDEASQAAEWLAGLIDRAARTGIGLDERVTAGEETTPAGKSKTRKKPRGDAADANPDSDNS